MSEYGDGVSCEEWNEEWQTAKKPQRCHACDLTIPVGHRLFRVDAVFDGEEDWCVRCERCQAIYAHLSKRIDVAGDVGEFCNWELDCGHDYRERWGEDPPPEIAALAFWLPGEPVG